jgi:hypothetical protein
MICWTVVINVTNLARVLNAGGVREDEPQKKKKTSQTKFMVMYSWELDP